MGLLVALWLATQSQKKSEGASKMSNWDKFQKGASKGFDEFIEVAKGNKGLDDAMRDIKDHFEKDDNSNDKNK
ncbi:hypothetical protein [Paenibacillus sp. MBLB4367]|uniref:hypothetical protein n=1 Tax=Paenibacillus sp. MBLB4367 TaxID=3384767 RepID=UPI003908065F